MYFEVANTPECVRKQRRQPPKPEPVEEIPCLSLAPFSRPPLVLFENVPIGSCAERQLDVVNPTKKTIQLSLGRAPPPGLMICLPESQLELSPQQGCFLGLRWSPVQPVAQRETIHFTDQYRGRYEVIVVLKTIIIKPVKMLKARRSPPKKIGVISPTPRNLKPMKKVSPKILTQKKILSKYPVTKIQEYVTETLTTRGHPVRVHSDKENASPQYRHSSSTNQRGRICPFESLTSMNSADSFNLNTLSTSDMFTMKGPNYYSYRENMSGVHQFEGDSFQGYAHPSTSAYRRSILSPSTRHNTDMVANAIDNLTFTPLKSIPKVKVTQTSHEEFHENNLYEHDFVDSIEVEKKIDNETHSIILVESHDEKDFQTNFLQGPSSMRLDLNFSVDESSVHSKKIPNTSSPKQLNSSAVNFTMTTDFSHITDTTFFPQRCSTERKIILTKAYHDDNFIPTPDGTEKTYRRLSSETYTKPDSLTTSVKPDQPKPPSPQYERPINESYSMPSTTAMTKPHNPKQLYFNERLPPQLIGRKARNCGDGVKSIIEANLWQPEKSPPRSLTPPLQSIPEESTQFSLSRIDRTNPAFHTFTINRTFDHHRDSMSCKRESLTLWKKKSVRCDPTLWKVPVIKETGRKTDILAIPSVRENLNNISTSSALHLITDVYAQSCTVDPFLSSTYFYDEESVDKFEKEFKRWLNYILTPPADLDSNLDDQKIDVGKIWTDKNKEIPAAPTREEVSSKYHNNHRLESVRKSARVLMLSQGMLEVFQKLGAQIDKKLISMRQDKNLPMDVGLQKTILGLLLCYNPLWLRIGLETLYGTVIPLTSNSDVFGLTEFIVQRMFKDPYMKSKHSHPHVPNYLLPSYIEHMRKFTLKKYFMLVFFLDQAKQKKLIFHDPCLFCRNAEYKESRDLLIQFTKEVIAGIGDITRHLRPLGYVVSHKQNYLDEYKYAVHNLALDLKDGIRLSRVMEIILVKPGLMPYMRTPPVSRLQKIHNVQVALTALKDSNYTIVGDITAKDIADGHREKTLSLLWQIIHVFRAPLFEKASIVIQAWWKKKYLRIVIDKKIKYRKEMIKKIKMKVDATIVIQKYWRMWMCRNALLKKKRAVRIIERWYITQKECKEAERIVKHLVLQQTSVARIQSWYRRMVKARLVMAIRHVYLDYCIQTKMKIYAANAIKRFWKRRTILRKWRYFVSAAVETDKTEKSRNKAATTIQSIVKGWLRRRRYTVIKKTVIICQAYIRGFLVRKQRASLIENVILIQRKFRNKMLMKKDHSSFTETKRAAIVVQSHFKMLKQRRYFIALKKSVCNIETRYIALVKMRRERIRFLKLKSSVDTVQKNRRAIVARRKYTQMRQSIIILQRRYKAHLAKKAQRQQFMKLKNSVRNIEKHYIALVQMRKSLNYYNNLKMSAIVIQKTFRMQTARKAYLLRRHSAIILQQRFRANIAMKTQRDSYIKMVHSITLIQKYYRSYEKTKKQRQTYINIRSAVVKIQSFVRAVQCMRKEKQNYERLKNATNTIQKLYRARLSMKKDKTEYMKLKQACLTIQFQYRALRAMRQEKTKYNKLKLAAILIQQHYRAVLSMRKERHNFNRIRNASITIQRNYRAYLSMTRALTEYTQLKQACLTIQSRYRALRAMRQEKNNYNKLKLAAILIQQHYRAILSMRKERQNFNRIRNASITIQRNYRAYLSMTKSLTEYTQLKQACLIIQSRYRALRAMRQEKNNYNKLKLAAILIQQHYRSILSMRKERQNFNRMRNASIIIQRNYRAYLSMMKALKEYTQLRQACLTIQSRYRALRAMRQEKNNYNKLKMTAIIIQRHYRAILSMRIERNNYNVIRNASVTIQRRYRARLNMKRDHSTYVKLKQACLAIQTRYRALKNMRQEQINYNKVKMATILIQQHYKAILSMRKERHNYNVLRKCSITIQRYFRAYYAEQTQRNHYLKLRLSTVLIQRRFREKKCMQVTRQFYVETRVACLTVQRRFRANIQMKLQRQQYLYLKRCTIVIQRLYIAKLLRRQCQQRYEALKQACVKIQNIYRAKRAMQTQRSSYQTLRVATLTIQKYYRAKKQGQCERTNYALIRNASIVLQRRFRARTEMMKQRMEYVRLRNATFIIQTRYRAHLAMKSNFEQYQKLRNSVITIQNRFRAYLLMKETCTQYLCQKMGANSIKTWYRACLAMRKQRMKYLQIIDAIRIIQQKYRAQRCMLETRKKYLQLKKAATLIQQRYRAKKVAHLTHQQYLIIHRSVKKIQSWYRSILCMRVERHRYIEMRQFKRRNEGARKIQLWFRSVLSMRRKRNQYMTLRKSVIKIQSIYRMRIVRKSYIQIRSSIITIQKIYRSYSLMKIQRQNFLQIKSAVIRIQSAWRCWHRRQIYIRIRRVICGIQAVYRRRKRIEQLRSEKQNRIKSVICVQKYYRRYICMKEYRIYREKVIYVQRRWRQMFHFRNSRSLRMKVRSAVVRLQALARGYLARQQVRRLREELVTRREQERQHRAASKIQALFRGNRVREDMKHRPDIAEMRQKLIRSEPVQREETMEQQNEYALEVLTHYRDIPSIIRAFVIIEYQTQLIPWLYHTTCNRVATSLLNYMMMTNRSVSTLDTVRPAAAVLVNLARYKTTALLIYSREKMGNVLKLIMRWSGQDSQYYRSLCTFMWLFGKYQHFKKDLTEFLHEPENCNMMHLIRAGVLRKQRMKTNVSKNKTLTPKQSKIQSKCRAHMNMSCCTDCGTIERQQSFHLPALEPDYYSFKRPDKPRFFEDDIHAIDSLFNMFDIPFK